MLFLLLGLLPAPLAAQEVFTVGGIEVDQTAETVSAAREAALAEGHARAFQKLMRRLLPRESWSRAPQLSPGQVENYLRDFAVADERTSSVRYLATLTFRFEPDSIRGLLRQHGLAFAEAQSQPLVVVPVLGEGESATLWTDENVWRAAWAARREPGELVPLVLPFGDLADIATLDAAQALAGDEAALDALAQRYQTAGALVTQLVIEGDPASETARLRLASRRYLSQIGPLTVEVLTQQPGETPEALLARAADAAAAPLAEDWKQANLLSFGSENRLVARVELAGLDSWVEIQRRLESLPNVVSSDPLELSRRRAVIAIVFLGSQQQLEQTLARRDLVLLPDAESGWLLALAGSVVQPMPAPQLQPQQSPPPAPDSVAPPAQPGGG